MEKKKITAHYTPIWPTPFGWANFGEDLRELNKKLVNDIEKERSLDKGKNGTFTNNKLGWQSKNTMEYRYDSFRQLLPKIKAIATPLMQHSGLPSNVTADVANLWANVILGNGGYAFPHTHGQGDTLWTGVYYPKGLHDIEDLDVMETNDYFKNGVTDNGGILVIKDGNISKELVKAPPPANQSTAYERNFSITPRESLLVMFPAWVEHMVTPTENNEKRYSISFGIFRQKSLVETKEAFPGPETQSADTMGWVTSESNENKIVDDVGIVQSEDNNITPIEKE